MTDAGAAIVVTTAERAKDCAKGGVAILGAAEGHDHSMISQMPDLTRAFGRNTGKQALDMAGVTHSDLDLMMIYDSFTYTVLVSLENLGILCDRAKVRTWLAISGRRRAATSQLTLQVAGCRIRIRGCMASSQLLRLSGSCAARLASGS